MNNCANKPASFLVTIPLPPFPRRPEVVAKPLSVQESATVEQQSMLEDSGARCSQQQYRYDLRQPVIWKAR